MPPETKYAKSGEINIAYQVVGTGVVDLVFVMGWASHLDWSWQEPSFARFLRRLASFSRLIQFDKRGTGFSDRTVGLATFEQRMDDVRAVMDAAGSRRAALLGVSEGAAMCALFAATYPERTSALIMIGGFARRSWAPDYPWGANEEERRSFLDQIERGWGGPVALARRAPSRATDEQFRQWWATFLRMSASPGAATALTRMNMEIDIRHILPMLQAPTLIIHRTDDLAIRVECSRYMAERIPGASYVELPGRDHLPFVGDQDAILDEVEGFLTGVRPVRTPDHHMLATVLVTGIRGATETAIGLDDTRWRAVRDSYAALVRRELAEHRGREIRTTDSGFLAAFDSPARSIRCACAIVDAAQSAGIDVGAALHAGECEIVGDVVRGVAVHLAAGIMAHAQPGSVVVSQTVKDLVAGSDIAFQDLGAYPLKGSTGEWRLYRISSATGATTAAPSRVEPGTGPQLAPLSHREGEVATLVALGLSNRQVAEELVIAESTVERHVANILKKLGYHSRAQIAAWTVAHGLLRAHSV
jgi:pimeloyl-ACP methyl ester carboxylesterase/class 3 adenylate cyclase/DNA-binding CsgD family transcriptional regulator